MIKIVAALITSLLTLACGRPPSNPEAHDDARLIVRLGEQTARLGALRPIAARLPFCEGGTVYEAHSPTATRGPTATLRVCVSDDDGPAPAHVSFRPNGATPLDPTATWYSGLLEPGTVELVRDQDGARLARVHGTAMLPVRYNVASFLSSLESQQVFLSGEARIEG